MATPLTWVATFAILMISLRWHYPDQVPRVGAGLDALSAWFSQAPLQIGP
jgi:TRAP-type C4-dicarboxylate transport system permease small subunit